MVADSERLLGADHPETLSFRNNLAAAYHDLGDMQRAIPLYEQVLADRQRVLGDDHPNTIVSRHNLAAAYAETGDVSRALPLLEQAVARQGTAPGETITPTL